MERDAARADPLLRVVERALRIEHIAEDREAPAQPNVPAVLQRFGIRRCPPRGLLSSQV